MELSDLIGHPYTKEFDCRWLASVVAPLLGKGFPDDATPEDKEDWPKAVKKAMHNHYRKVKVPKIGDLAIFAIPEGKKTEWHCGTIIKPGWMITTRESIGVHLARLNSVMWRVCLRGYYEFVN